MIVSASRRTDIPALYPQWLANRIEAGYALSVNPFNPNMTRRVDLRPSPIGGSPKNSLETGENAKLEILADTGKPLTKPTINGKPRRSFENEEGKKNDRRHTKKYFEDHFSPLTTSIEGYPGVFNKRPGDMEALVLWTRNPGPILQYLPKWEERGIRSYFLVTLTGYPEVLEPGTPKVTEAVDTIGRLAAVVGRERIVWRYDPIIACRELRMDVGYHRENFSRLAKLVEPFLSKVIVSTYDSYKKSDKRLAVAGIAHDKNEARAAAVEIAEKCAKMGLAITSCCEDLGDAGIKPGGCIDPRHLDSLWNLGLGSVTDKGQRSGCLCAPSVDIGSYDTCTHGCLYCYATGSVKNAATKFTAHDPDKEFLA